MTPLSIRRLLEEKSDRPASEQVVLWVKRRLFLKRRWEGVAEDGTAFAFDLEARLADGCVIHRTEAADYVVRQESEPVYEIPAPTAALAALVGWRIGNLHFPIEILPGAVRVTRDPLVKETIDKEGWACEEIETVFKPLKIPPEVLGLVPGQGTSQGQGEANASGA